VTESEALTRATALARRHFDHRGDASPRTVQGFVLREQARMLGRPVPRGIDMPRGVRVAAPEPPEQDLMALLQASIEAVRA
jgi:hypothetical protein